MSDSDDADLGFIPKIKAIELAIMHFITEEHKRLLSDEAIKRAVKALIPYFDKFDENEDPGWKARQINDMRAAIKAAIESE